MTRLALLLTLLLVLLAPALARADTPVCEAICSVNRNCSNTGVACKPDDRECTNGATATGLEVKCEQQCAAGTLFIYCPPDSGRSDSGYVWILLALSGVLAAGGGALAWMMLKKKA